MTKALQEWWYIPLTGWRPFMFSRLLLKRRHLPVKVKGPKSASLRASSPWLAWSTLFTPRSETAGDPLFLLCILRARSWWRSGLFGAWPAILLLYLLSSAFRCSVLVSLTDYRGRNKIPQIMFRLMRKDMFLSDPGLSQKVQLSFPENPVWGFRRRPSWLRRLLHCTCFWHSHGAEQGSWAKTAFCHDAACLAVGPLSGTAETEGGRDEHSPQAPEICLYSLLEERVGMPCDLAESAAREPGIGCLSWV